MNTIMHMNNDNNIKNGYMYIFVCVFCIYKILLNYLEISSRLISY